MQLSPMKAETIFAVTKIARRGIFTIIMEVMFRIVQMNANGTH